MTVHTGELSVSTQGDTDVVDITAEVERVVETAWVAEGQALVFVRGSTAAIATMEFEPGGVRDLREMLERLIPTHGDYEHNRLNQDTNPMPISEPRWSGPPRPCRSSTASLPSAPGSRSS